MEEHEVKHATAGSIAEGKCPHHWVIEPPTGSTSLGMCKLCGAISEFSNDFRGSRLVMPGPSSEETMSSEGGPGKGAI